MPERRSPPASTNCRRTFRAKLYNKDQIDPQQPIGPSAYRDLKPKKGPPWTIGYASSYAGNTWRANALEHLEKDIVPKWKKLGLVKDLIVTQSNLKDATQIQQMRQLVDRGVDALIICCSNPTALNETVKYAYDKGVPVFSMIGYVTSPYAVNSSTNFVVTGKKMGDWMVDELGKKGNVLVVEGIPGTSTSELARSRHQDSALRQRPDVKIVGDVAGMWTDQVAQAEVQKWLANHPGDLDGVVVQSAAELGVLRALAAVGPQDAAGRDRRRGRRALLLAPSSEIRQRGDPGLAAGRRNGAACGTS